ncbi:MAG: hypothetical protein K940chlam7_00763 [Chlamydiae bacterium]|nr:hypothetical protein [Chlamydiota bacterium]
MFQFRFFLLLLVFATSAGFVKGEEQPDFIVEGDVILKSWWHSGRSPIRKKTFFEVDPMITPTHRFVVDADFQFRIETPPTRKIGHVESIAALEPPADFILVPGNITYSAQYFGWFGVSEDQLGHFIDAVVDPLEAAGLEVHVCLGDSDVSYGVLDWIKAREGGLRYSFLYGGVRFICCGMYPDAETVEWLKTISNDLPVVVFWHHNVSGAYSADNDAPGGQWWTEEERKAVFDVLTVRFDTKAVFVGHWQYSTIYYYRGIPVVLVGGDKFCVTDIDSEKNLHFSLEK